MKTYYKAVSGPYSGNYFSNWIGSAYLDLNKRYDIGEYVFADSRSLKRGYGLFVFETFEHAIKSCPHDTILECVSKAKPLPMIAGSGLVNDIQDIYYSECFSILIERLSQDYFESQYPGTVMLPYLKVVGIAKEI